jgi:hypothetical protein
MSNIKTSAFGEAVYPHLNQADTAFSAEGIYQVKLKVSKEDAKAMVDEIHTVINTKLIEEGKRQPNKTDQFKRAPLPYEELEDGSVQFHFKTKFKPKLVDHNLEPVDKNIWGGSIIRCNYTPVGYYVASTGLGCTLRLSGVQIKKLVEGSNSLSGFSKIEPEVNQELI